MGRRRGPSCRVARTVRIPGGEWALDLVQRAASATSRSLATALAMRSPSDGDGTGSIDVTVAT